MPDFVIRHEFEGRTGATEARSGWVELYYYTTVDAIAALARGNSLATQRRKVLHPNYGLVEVVISDEAVLRDSLATAYNDQDSAGTYPVPSPDPGAELPYVSLLLRAEAGSPRRRGIHLRGIPKGIAFGAGVYRPDAPFQNGLNAFTRNLLGQQPLQLRKRTAGAPTFLTNVALSLGGSALAVTTAVAHGLAVNDLVKITGVEGISRPVNTQWVVASVGAPDTFTTFPKRNAKMTGAYTFGGQVVKLTTTYPALTSAQPERIAKKNTGRPFDLQRGRRRVQV